MQHEPFWGLKEKGLGQEISVAAESGMVYADNKAVYSIKGLRERYRYAVIDRELFNVIQNGNWDIYIVDADGKNLTRLTMNESTDYKPVWSGDYIYFISDRGNKKGNSNIWRFKAD